MQPCMRVVSTKEVCRIGQPLSEEKIGSRSRLPLGNHWGLPAGGLKFSEGRHDDNDTAQRSAAGDHHPWSSQSLRHTGRGVDIANRRPMQQRTVTAITEAAEALGAVACPVLGRTGAADEVHLFRDGALRASIFVPTTGRLGIWRSDTDQVTANTPTEAVRRALDPLRKHTH